MTWSKFTGATPIDADTFLARAAQQEEFDRWQEEERGRRRSPLCDCTVMPGGISMCRDCIEREDER